MSSQRVALVTGASSGIGAALAETMVGRGWKVVAHGRRRDALQALRDRCSVPANVEITTAELADDAGLDSLADFTSALGRLDALVHCAGDLCFGDFVATPMSSLDDLWRVNVRAPWRLTALLVERLEQSRGVVVFVNSVSASKPSRGLAAYGMTKAALSYAADAIRDELAARHVRVCSLYLGRTATAMQQRLRALEGAPYDPAGMLRPEAVAGTILAMLDPESPGQLSSVVLRPA